MEQNNPSKFCGWVLQKSYLAPFRRYILNGEGGLTGMIASLETYLWEYDGEFKPGCAAYLRYLSKEYQRRYRKNELRLGVLDDYFTEPENGEDVASQMFDSHGFSTLGAWVIENLDEPIPQPQEKEPNETLLGVSQGSAPTPSGATLPRVCEQTGREHYLPNIDSYLNDRKNITLDGKRNPSIRELWHKFLSARTDKEIDIISVWVRLQPITYQEVADLCDTDLQLVDKVAKQVREWGIRHEAKL